MNAWHCLLPAYIRLHQHNMDITTKTIESVPITHATCHASSKERHRKKKNYIEKERKNTYITHRQWTRVAVALRLKNA